MDDRAKAIAEVQDSLRNVSLVTPEMPSLVSNGAFDDLTSATVTMFQNMHGLNADGKVDFDTWNAIRDEGNRVKKLFAQPVQVTAITNEDLPLRIGMNNRFVLTLKKMLSYLSEQFDNIDDIEINSIFDKFTEDAVRQWQFIIREKETGEVDKKTWNALAQFYLI